MTSIWSLFNYQDDARSNKHKTVQSYSGARGFEPRIGDTSSVCFHNTSQHIQASAYHLQPAKVKTA